MVIRQADGKESAAFVDEAFGLVCIVYDLHKQKNDLMKFNSD